VGLHTARAGLDPMRLAQRELALVGIWAYSVHEWPRIMRQIASGSFPVERVISGRVPLADVVGGGFDVLVDPAGDQTKILVTPE
jgi:(R,R)-butanediol dehydrogenase/meso-butanediol dehydrogenase/diacetyl reductase